MISLEQQCAHVCFDWDACQSVAQVLLWVSALCGNDLGQAVRSRQENRSHRQVQIQPDHVDPVGEVRVAFLRLDSARAA